MSGLKLVVPLSFTDNTLPKLRDDPLLYDQGTVLLLETNHPVRPMLVPADVGQSVPNIAVPSLQALQPGGGSTDYDAPIQANAGFVAAGIGKFEKSAKGGVHIISGQATTATNRWGKIPLPEAARAYLTANPGHLFYASIWGRVTRASTITNGIHKWSDFGVGQFWEAPVGAGQDVVYPTDTTRKNWRADGAVGIGAGGSGTRANTGPLFASIGRTPISTPVVSAPTVGSNGLVTGGSVSSNKSPSIVFYRALIEDLTVSGRTYAQVEALDYAEYTAQVLSAGGRYYNDTVPTDPTTYA